MKRLESFLCAGLLFCSLQVAAEPQVQVVGLFPGAAVLSVDGRRQLVKVGQTGPGGVQVVSADSQGAVLKIDGAQRSYPLSRDYSATSGAAAQLAQVRIAKGLGGHYWVTGSISGTSVPFLVDTGATSVAMNEGAAKRLGIDYRVKGQPIRVSTASGTAKAWLVKLDSVKIGAITVIGVEAAVVEGDSPTEMLLGMSFLSRVSWREDQGMLLLESKI